MANVDSDRDRAIAELVAGVRLGRPVVPLLGAGISVEAGVPPLSELTRYLARTKQYLRRRVFKHRQPRKVSLTPADFLIGTDTFDLPPFEHQPRDFLREFGWPDPHELNSMLWHWLWQSLPSSSEERFFDAMNLLVDGEILESLGRIDKEFSNQVRRTRPRRAAKDAEGASEEEEWQLLGSYWKIL